MSAAGSGWPKLGLFTLRQVVLVGAQVGYGTGPDVHVGGGVGERAVALAGVVGYRYRRYSRVKKTGWVVTTWAWAVQASSVSSRAVKRRSVCIG